MVMFVLRLQCDSVPNPMQAASTPQTHSGEDTNTQRVSTHPFWELNPHPHIILYYFYIVLVCLLSEQSTRHKWEQNYQEISKYLENLPTPRKEVGHLSNIIQKCELTFAYYKKLNRIWDGCCPWWQSFHVVWFYLQLTVLFKRLSHMLAVIGSLSTIQ